MARDATAKAAVRDACKVPPQQLAQQVKGHASFSIEKRDGTQAMLRKGTGSYVAQAHTAKSVSSALRSAVMQLTKNNMKTMYDNTSDGWDVKEKETELFDAQARFITIRRAEDDAATLIAFVNWRFDLDECAADDPVAPQDDGGEVEVAYCYELQVASSHRRSGLGALLMGMLEDVGRANRMRKVVLTVFIDNEKAIQFYARNGYQIDSNSPSRFADDEDHDDDESVAEYEIMSKAI